MANFGVPGDGDVVKECYFSLFIFSLEKWDVLRDARGVPVTAKNRPKPLDLGGMDVGVSSHYGLL